MMNPFEILGMPLKLVIPENELEQQFDVRGKLSHPDAGGSDEEFSNVRSAYEQLKTPAGRIRAALEITVDEMDSRGTIPSEVMNHFSEVAMTLEKVDAILREQSGVRSGLTRALVNAKIPALKGQLEEVLADLLKSEASLLGRFAEFDEVGWEKSFQAMAEVSRGLIFLSKWKSQLQGATGKLFEALLGGAR
ncbi:MAG: hypothetical protein ABF337_07255 [Akkermansiaceae bacterium]